MPNPQNRNDRRKGEDRSETLIIPHITKEMLETARRMAEEGASRAEIEKLTSDTCDDNFEAYVGSATNETELDVNAMFPTKNSWDKGDRDIVCIVIPAEGKTLTQSVKGSGM